MFVMWTVNTISLILSVMKFTLRLRLFGAKQQNNH
jgi:hypothetical protein